MDKVEKAVIELGGKWPEKEEAQGVLLFCKKDNYCDGEGVCYRGKYYAGTKLYDKELFEGICTYPEFMEARKRLENKPSWGDAPEEARSLTQDDIGNWTFWRGRPVETEYGGWASDDAAWHCGKGHVFGDWRQSLEPRPQPDNKEGEGVEWYDYETRQAFSLPPAGVECETLIALQWHNCKVVGFDGPACVFAVDGGGYDGSLYMQDFRPLDWDREPCHRDKCIEAAKNAMAKNDEWAEKGFVTILGDLYDEGMLRLPNDKEGE